MTRRRVQGVVIRRKLARMAMASVVAIGHAWIAMLGASGCGSVNASVDASADTASDADAASDTSTDMVDAPVTVDSAVCDAVCTGLLAYWKLDGDLVDVIGGRLLTLVNAEQVAHGSGRALDFQGDNARALAPHPDPTLDNLQSFTFTSLIKPRTSGLGSFGPILAKGGTGSDAAKRWLINGIHGGLAFELVVKRVSQEGGADSATTASGGWQFVAATFDSTNVHLYLDSMEMSYSSIPTAGSGDLKDDSATAYAIGGYPAQTMNGVFDGQIDEVRIYGRALSSKEVEDVRTAAAPLLQAQ